MGNVFSWMKQKYLQVFDRYCAFLVACGLMVALPAVPAYASDTTTSDATIQDMLGIFSDLFAWILDEGATLLAWMLDKPILMIAMGLFFCGAIIAFLMRIYHSV